MTGSLPDYYLPRPGAWSAEDTTSFERLYADQVRPGDGRRVSYDLAAPRWQFLCWLVEHHDVLLHGSGRADIDEFALHHPHDKDPFADRPAVFAASDGIWAMFFAVVDRAVAKSLINASFVAVDGDADARASYYYFSVNADALAARAWRDGTVYVLPRAGFEQQEGEEHEGLWIESNQWVSTRPVRPLASLAVTPEDFPFLTDVHGHDVDTVVARAAADPDAFPWRD
jgi:hypothetical protein